MSNNSGIPKLIFWVVPVVAFLAVLAAVVINWADSSRNSLPILEHIPPFALTASSGKSFTQVDLRGRITVVDFFFTNCKGICPKMTANMAGLYKIFEGSDKVHFLSITVDPDRDSLEVLRRFAKEQGVTDDRWVFARGELKDVAHLLEKGFLLAADELPTGHPPNFILVDYNGDIRGYYEGNDSSSVEILKKNMRVLARKI